MDAGAVWQIGVGVATVAGSGALNLWVISWQMGKREGALAKTIEGLEKQRDEDKKAFEQFQRDVLTENVNISRRFERVADGLSRTNEKIAALTGKVNGTNYRAGQEER
jgi:hypothetical protein